MSESKNRPNRAIAIILAATVGCGVGHFYAGVRRRASGWLAGFVVLMLLFAALFLVVGRWIGFFPALSVWVGIVLISWLGPIIDLIAISDKRFVATPVWQVVAFTLLFAVSALAMPIFMRIVLLEVYMIPAESILVRRSGKRSASRTFPRASDLHLAERDARRRGLEQGGA